KRYGVAFGVEFLCWCAIGYALLLTKSRTAYAGGITAAGLLVCVTVFSVVRTLRGRLSVLVVMIVLTAGVGIGGYLTGGIDRLVWEEAPKSLKYRMEYWQGAMGVIGEAPVFGTGPGQFRQHYLKYKLPESSEEIVDPHNMLLDVWSNGGMIGLVGLIGILGWVLWRGVKLGLRGVESSTNEMSSEGVDPVWNQMGWMLGVVGMLTMYVIGGGGDQELLMVGGVWLGLMLAGGIWLRGDDSGRSAEWGIIALIGIGVHLLGNGGIGMPTVLIAFLSLLAMTVPTVAQEGAPEGRRLWMLIGWPVGWGVACLVFGALPVTNASDLKESAKFARTPESRLGLLRQGAEADRIAPDGWGDFSVALTEEWLRQPKQRVAVYEQALAAAEEAVRRDPYNGVRYRQAASLMWYRARVEKDPSFALAAGEYFEKAIERSPTRADLIADAAAAMELAGKGERSRELARKGLELDELNHQAGHSDKYLPEKQVEELRKIVEGKQEPQPLSEK
ncbi:MAG: O-antigen ligase family protein, partial [Planctomycetaceae bacterium]|nr:O-antigen ligase family protein [Planctomycetaceae bacterium]